jgi:hypothetical protein
MRKMCEKTHNLSNYKSTKFLLQTVPDYIDMMIPCWEQHLVTDRFMPGEDKTSLPQK